MWSLDRGAMMTLRFWRKYIHDDPQFFTVIETYKWQAGTFLICSPYEDILRLMVNHLQAFL